jgi:aminopeptidase N
MQRYYLLLSYFFVIFNLSTPLSTKAQLGQNPDVLRGSLTPERTWWDVLQYNLYFIPNPKNKTLVGTNTITFKVLRTGSKMQIDLQGDMKITAASLDNVTVTKIERQADVYYITFDKGLVAGKSYNLLLQFSGAPRVAKNAPWDGGFTWTTDEKKRPWISTSCQGLGASAWWPCKDHQSDEPDNGVVITIEPPAKQNAVSNGRMQPKVKKDKSKAQTWQVKNPINNYAVNLSTGNYVSFKDTFNGEKGILDLEYHVLDYNLQKAKEQFKQVKPMLKAMEYWFGPYPFYNDGYKLIETPFLGMEHQSGIAYGNKYKNGYLGMDMSGTGWGKNWDYIIIHESGHEWFGNNVSTKDIADMWVHEGFTTYSEALYVDYHYGKEAGSAYVIGLRRNIQNDQNIIGPYNVNQEGSGDMYSKGANMLHTIRHVINDDEKFRNLLRSIQKEFGLKTCTSAEIESFIIRSTGIDFIKVFEQYLRSTKIPKLEYKYEVGNLKYRYTNVVSGFNMPIKVMAKDKELWLKPTTEWQTELNVESIAIDKNFYVYYSKLD